MITFLMAVALAAPAAPQPVQSVRTHQASGFAFPTEYDGMEARELHTMQSREIPNLITSLQYRRDRQLITVSLFRATYPNAALWFERADAALHAGSGNFRGEGTDGSRQVTMGPTTVPNGLVETFGRLDSDLSIGFSVTQHGRYLLLLQVTSGTRNRRELHQRIADFAASIRYPQDSLPVLPLQLPEPCADTGMVADIISGYRANSLEPDAGVRERAAEIGRTQVLGELTGATGLAARPGDYCRAFVGVNDALAAVPHGTATVYRLKSDQSAGWIALVGSNGHSVTAKRLTSGQADSVSAAFASRLGTTHAVLFSNGDPHIGLALMRPAAPSRKLRTGS